MTWTSIAFYGRDASGRRQFQDASLRLNSYLDVCSVLCQWPHFHASNFRNRVKVLLNCDCNNTNMVEAPFKVDGEVVAALRNAVRDCSDRGLAYASKW